MVRSLFFTLIFLSFSSASWAQNTQSVSIPLKTVKKPAADLVNTNGQVLDVGEASQMAEQGVDLSLLNPQENRLWQNQKYPSVEHVQAFPAAETGVIFSSSEAINAQIYTHSSRVIAKADQNSFYRLTISRLAHNSLMRAVLLRKLGYFLPSPKYYRTLRVYFASEEQKAKYIDEVEQEGVIVDLSDRKWILENNTKDHSLLLTDVILETANPDYYDIANGTAPNPIFDRATVARLSRYRAFRALIVPYSLVDIPESINRYSPKLGSIMAGHAILMYPLASSFAAITVEDARWITRRLLSLTDQDIREIVQAGQFPSELNELIYAKMVHRIRNAAELFDLNNDFHLALPNLFVNSPSGLVKDGKVTKERIPGYPIRFAHGDREAPFKSGDMARFIGVKGRSAAIATALGEISKKLQLLKVEDAAIKHGEKVRQRIIDNLRNKKANPFEQKVEAWGGPVAGFNVSATRTVSTGTYYDSTAPIQLVDNVSVGAQLGYFLALDGVPKVSPVGGANLILSRDYTHVRPIISMTEGSKVEWKNIVVPSFMKKLSAVLDDEMTEIDSDGTKVKRYSVDAFLSELREGEVFTITDSVVTNLYAQASAGIDALLGITPLNFMNSISLGADANRVVLRQTSIIRTPNGLQVFVRKQNGKINGVTMDVNYFINIMKIRAQTQHTDLKTDAFVIKYSPSLSDDVNSNQGSELAKEFVEIRSKLRPALNSLFKHNDPDLFYSAFQYQKFDIDHKLKTKEMRSKFLIWRLTQFQEDHWVNILYPASEEAPELKPENEKVVLFSHKRGQLVGRDLLGLFIDLVEGVINRKSKVSVDLGGSNDPNPANTPFGKAYWRIANTEADLSPQGFRYPRVATLSHVWGGWKLKREKFFDLLNEISGQFKNTPVGSYRLIEPEAFMNVQSVDFYRINAMLSVLPSGLDKVRDLILQPDAKGKKVDKARALAGIFQKLSKKLGKGARPQEKELYKEILTILGNDNFEAGKAIIGQACLQAEIYNEGSGNNNGKWLNGNYYECLTPWLEKLMHLSSTYPVKDDAAQVRWTTEVLYILDEYIPLPQLLKYLGEENFIFTVRINGFRTGDEDADLEYFSNTVGDPKTNIDYANGLFQMFANKTGIIPIEIDRTMGGFR